MTYKNILGIGIFVGFHTLKYLVELLLFDLFNIHVSVELLFQRLIVSIVSSPDEDSYMSVKDSQSLVNVISLLAHHLEPDGPQVATSKYCASHFYGLLFMFLKKYKYSQTFSQQPPKMSSLGGCLWVLVLTRA